MKDARTIDPRDEAFEEARAEDARQPDEARAAARPADARAEDARDRGRIIDMREHPEVRSAQMGQRTGRAAMNLLGQEPFRQFTKLAAQGKAKVVAAFD
ncbi:MAG: hypothetical protein GC134_04595 [Proteobacteria bacterium]|nr:hypothetical protein [Pseudomonadota bacterium]